MISEAALLDRMASESWKQKKRAKMVRYLVGKGFKPQNLGYHGEFSKKGKPIVPNPVSRTKRPTQWPRARMGKCVSHTIEEKGAYFNRVRDWKIGKFCAVMQKIHGQQVPAVQCHHRNGRYGGLLMFELFWIPVSEEGHLWIHENPEKARENGWLCSEQDWNDEVFCHEIKI